MKILGTLVDTDPIGSWIQIDWWLIKQQCDRGNEGGVIVHWMSDIASLHVTWHIHISSGRPVWTTCQSMGPGHEQEEIDWAYSTCLVCQS